MKLDNGKSSKTKQQRILLVNDEKNIRVVFSDILRAKGYQVKAVKDGYEAIKLVDEETFDLVIVGLRMPQMSGIKVLENIKRENPQIPVIICTGYKTTATVIEAMRKGAYDYLALYPPNECIAKIERALEERTKKLQTEKHETPAEKISSK